MFSTLLETRAVRRRSRGGAAASLALHGAVLAGAVLLTGRVRAADSAPPTPESIVYVAPAPPPLPVVAARPQAATPPPTLQGFQVVAANIDVPVSIPEITVASIVIDAGNFTGHGRPGGVANGSTDGAAGSVAGTGDPRVPFLASQVDKPASQLPGRGVPVYPPALREIGLEGEVEVTFVIDTTGRAELATVRVSRATHPAFARAVRDALPDMRFLPAEVAGRPVRQLVQLPFRFVAR